MGDEAPEPIYFASPEELRDWFDANHETASELWLGYWKKAAGRPTVTWAQAVDEALCVGWIDGIRKRIDEASYKIRFTPRRPGSIWSAINIARVAALKKEGRMRPATMGPRELVACCKKLFSAIDPPSPARWRITGSSMNGVISFQRLTSLWWESMSTMIMSW